MKRKLNPISGLETSENKNQHSTLCIENIPDEIIEEIRRETIEELKLEITQKVSEDISSAIREEIADDIRMELADEIRMEIISEVSQEITKEVKEETESRIYNNLDESAQFLLSSARQSEIVKLITDSDYRNNLFRELYLE